MYAYMINQGTLFTNKFIWKLKLPLKIKIFLWYRQRGVILTKDNLAKRNRTSSQKYCFCDHNATIKHLFLIAAMRKLFGILFILLLGEPHLDLLLTCLEAGSRAWGGRIKHRFLWEVLLLFGQFGVLVTTLFLRKNKIFLLCMLFSKEHIGCDSRRSYSMKIKGRRFDVQAKRWRLSL